MRIQSIQQNYFNGNYCQVNRTNSTNALKLNNQKQNCINFKGDARGCLMGCLATIAMFFVCAIFPPAIIVAIPVIAIAAKEGSRGNL